MIAATSSYDSASRSQLYARSADIQGQQNSVRRRDVDGNRSDAVSQLFKAISGDQDSQGQAGFTSSVARLGQSILSSLLQSQAAGQGGAAGLGAGGPPDPEEMLAKIDTNSDGNVSRDEFVAGRPDGVDADKAGELFDKIDTEGSGSLTKDQLKEGMSRNHPPPGGPGGGGQASSVLGGSGAQGNDVLGELIKMIGSYGRQSGGTASVTGYSTTA